MVTKDYINRIKKVESRLEEWLNKYNKIKDDFKDTNTGKEKILLEQNITYFEIPFKRIDDAIEKYNELIKLLDGVNGFTTIKELKKAKVSLDESHYLEILIKELRSERNSRVAIDHFEKEVNGYIKTIESQGDKRTAKLLLNNKYVKMAIKFQEERSKLEEILNKIKNDDGNWKYFIKDFLKTLKTTIYRFGKEFNDEEFAKELMYERDTFKESHNDWIEFLSKKLDAFQHNFNIVVQRENNAREAMIIILSRRNTTIRKEAEKVRIKTLKIIKSRIIAIEAKRKRILNRLDNFVKEQTKRIGAMKMIEESGKDLKKQFASIMQEKNNWIKTELEMRRRISSLSKEQYLENIAQILPVLERIHQHREAISVKGSDLKKIGHKAEIMVEEQVEILSMIENDLDKDPMKKIEHKIAA